MAVNWDNITIPFTQGVDRSRDDYLAAPGNVYTAQNLVASDKNTLQTMSSFDTLRTWTTRGSNPRCVALPGGGAIAEFQHESNAVPAAVYADSTAVTVSANERTRSDVIWRGGKASLFDATTIYNHIVVAWVDDYETAPSGNKYVSVAVIRTSDMREVFASRVTLAANGSPVLGIRASEFTGSVQTDCAIVVRTAVAFFLFPVFYNGVYFETGTVSTFAANCPTTASDSLAGACFDAVPAGLPGYCFLCYVQGGSPDTIVAMLLGSGSIISQTPLAMVADTIPGGHLPASNLSVTRSGTTFYAAISIGSGGAGTGVFVFQAGTLSAGPDTGKNFTISVTSPGRVSFDRNYDTNAVLVYESHGAAFPAAPFIDAQYNANTLNGMQHYTSSSEVYRVVVSPGSPPTYAGQTLINAHGVIAGTPLWTQSGGSTLDELFNITEDDAYYPSQVLTNRGTGAPVIACVAAGTAFGLSADYIGSTASQKHPGREPVPQTLASTGDTIVVVHAPVDGDVDPAFSSAKTSVSSPPIPYVPGRSIRLTRVSRAGHLTSCQANGTVWLAGSKQKQISGSAVQDELLAPPILHSLTAGGEGDTILTAATNYLICATFLVPDSNGNFVESAPSPAYQFYHATIRSFSVRLRPTLTPLVRGCKVRLYRTSGADLVTFYLDGEYDAALAVTGFAMVAATPDSTIASSVVLYTQQGEVENDAPPPCHDIIEHQNRLFCTDGTEIRLTKPLTPGTGPRWFPRTVRIDVPDTFGRAVKLVSMDEKLLVFCEKKIGVVDGGGPTLDGLGATFSEISEVSTIGTPADATYSFAQTDEGVWWQSSRGIRLLTRGYQLATTETGELGRQVDEILKFPVVYSGDFEYTVAGAAAVDDSVMWFLRDPAGSYSPVGLRYSRGVFTTFDMPASSTGVCSATAVTSGKLRYATRASLFGFPEASPTSSKDRYPTLDTGWLRVGGGLQDFSRVRKMVLTGQARGLYGYSGNLSAKAWNFTVKVWYDMIDGSSASVTEVSGAAVAPTQEDATGAGWYNIRFEVPLSVQKCSAIRFEVTATPNAGAKGLRFTGMTLEVGRKRGLAKKFASSERK
jgi:hypothetical protein